MGFFRGLFSLLGRAMLCGYFAWLAVRYWLVFDDSLAKWESVGIPEPQYALTGTIVCLALGCLFVLTGLAARFGAFLLLLYLAAYMYYFQPFWTLPPAERLPELMDGLKTLALGGALIMLIGNGAGAASFRGRRHESYDYGDFDR